MFPRTPRPIPQIIGIIERWKDSNKKTWIRTFSGIRTFPEHKTCQKIEAFKFVLRWIEIHQKRQRQNRETHKWKVIEILNYRIPLINIHTMKFYVNITFSNYLQPKRIRQLLTWRFLFCRNQTQRFVKNNSHNEKKVVIIVGSLNYSQLYWNEWADEGSANVPSLEIRDVKSELQKKLLNSVTHAIWFAFRCKNTAKSKHF